MLVLDSYTLRLLFEGLVTAKKAIFWLIIFTILPDYFLILPKLKLDIIGQMPVVKFFSCKETRFFVN
jgi:hypothetical protein